MNEMLLRGCMLKNSNYVLGLVVYTGKESRIQMNAAKTPNKVGESSFSPIGCACLSFRLAGSTSTTTTPGVRLCDFHWLIACMCAIRRLLRPLPELPDHLHHHAAAGHVHLLRGRLLHMAQICGLPTLPAGHGCICGGELPEWPRLHPHPAHHLLDPLLLPRPHLPLRHPGNCKVLAGIVPSCNSPPCSFPLLGCQ